MTGTPRPTQTSTIEAATAEPGDLTHDWVGAATIRLDEKIAKHANLRGCFRAKIDQRIDVLDVYCAVCRRPYDDVADQPCEGKRDNRHLIGGDQSVRAKRKVAQIEPGVTVMPGPRISRRGIEAVVGGTVSVRR